MRKQILTASMIVVLLICIACACGAASAAGKSFTLYYGSEAVASYEAGGTVDVSGYGEFAGFLEATDNGDSMPACDVYLLSADNARTPK